MAKYHTKEYKPLFFISGRNSKYLNNIKGFTDNFVFVLKMERIANFKYRKNTNKVGNLLCE